MPNAAPEMTVSPASAAPIAISAATRCPYAVFALRPDDRQRPLRQPGQRPAPDIQRHRRHRIPRPPRGRHRKRDHRLLRPLRIARPDDPGADRAGGGQIGIDQRLQLGRRQLLRPGRGRRQHRARRPPIPNPDPRAHRPHPADVLRHRRLRRLEHPQQTGPTPLQFTSRIDHHAFSPHRSANAVATSADDGTSRPPRSALVSANRNTRS